jgi:hypothetical protein
MPRCPHDRAESWTIGMIFTLAVMIDRVLASVHDPTFGGFVLPRPEIFAYILGLSLAVTACIVPILIRRERRLRAARTARFTNAGANAAA